MQHLGVQVGWLFRSAVLAVYFPDPRHTKPYLRLKQTILTHLTRVCPQLIRCSRTLRLNFVGGHFVVSNKGEREHTYQALQLQA